jgi:hypothetical protein
MTAEELTERLQAKDQYLSIKLNCSDTDIYYKNEITCCTISGDITRLSEETIDLIYKEILLWASRPRPKQKPAFQKAMSNTAKKKKGTKKSKETDDLIGPEPRKKKRRKH